MRRTCNFAKQINMLFPDKPATNALAGKGNSSVESGLREIRPSRSGEGSEVLAATKQDQNLHLPD